jgi:3-deoxy-D-manno-octulosonic-acid transferase
MMRLAYTLLLYLMVPRILVRLWWRSRKEPAYGEHINERFARYHEPRREACIWIHAVSVGETRAAEPIITRLLSSYPDRRILLTHMTPTGRATGRELYGDRLEQAYLPYDFPGAMRRFLDHHRVSLGLIMETEVWFNLIHACRERAIPLHLVNARLSDKSRNGYARIRRLAEAGFNELTSIAAQSDVDAARFRSLGARNVTVIGNVKFDMTPSADLIDRGREWRRVWGESRPVWLAASTRQGEEALLLDVLEQVRVPGALAVIVPRHPQRFDDVAALLDARGIAYVRRSGTDVPTAGTRVLLGDSMGEMTAYYAACDVAFIGGSLKPFGAHNLIEACAQGKPVVIGPSVFNFQEATELAIDAGGAVQVTDAAGAAREIMAILTNDHRREEMGKAGARFAATHRGAVDRLVALLKL